MLCSTAHVVSKPRRLTPHTRPRSSTHAGHHDVLPTRSVNSSDSSYPRPCPSGAWAQDRPVPSGTRTALALPWVIVGTGSPHVEASNDVLVTVARVTTTVGARCNPRPPVARPL